MCIYTVVSYFSSEFTQKIGVSLKLFLYGLREYSICLVYH
jgi:hypothetical protein